jgi:hypothetical protein
MHCMRSSVGQIVMLSRHGASFPGIAFADLMARMCFGQNIGPGSGAYTDNASAYCVHVPPATLTFQTLHTRA